MTAEVDGVEVDIDVSQVGISYAIGDPLEPGRVAGNKSTTFKMPATNRVKAVMGGSGMSERPITGDPVLQFKKGGVVYLEQVIRPIEWDREEVRSVSVGNNAGWIADLKNLKINTLDLGESPRIESTLILSSWYTEDELLYFPMIDYGYPWNAAIAAIVEDFRPAVRCHRILKKAFGDLGYSVKVTGGLNAVWKKFVMPCTEEVSAGERDKDNNTLDLTQTTPAGHSLVNIPVTSAQPIPVVIDTVTDPGGNNTGTYNYTVPFDMTISSVLDIVLSDGGTGGSTLYFGLFNVGTNALVSAAIPVSYLTGETITKSINFGEYEATAGDVLAVRVYNITGVCAFSATCNLRFRPTDIPYQENITITVAESLPKISAWDVLMGINYTRCLCFDTDDRTKVVTISYNEDKYRPIAEGTSLIGREDHTDPPVKGNPLKAKRIIFGWKDDADDFYLDRANERAGDRGFGGLVKDIEGGTLNEKKVEVPFAATAMRMYTGDIFIPVMREQEVRAAVVGEEDRNFKRTPRLLLSDGIAYTNATGWDFDGAPMTIYPKCFFVYPGETDLCMSFYPETLYGSCGPGMVASHYGGYLRRMERSKTLSIDLMLYDHELKSLDMGVPVEVLDDFGAGWYYFTEIKQKKFGVDEPTKCELIQV